MWKDRYMFVIWVRLIMTFVDKSCILYERWDAEQYVTLVPWALQNITMGCSKSCTRRLSFRQTSQHPTVIFWRPTSLSNVMQPYLPYWWFITTSEATRCLERGHWDKCIKIESTCIFLFGEGFHFQISSSNNIGSIQHPYSDIDVRFFVYLKSESIIIFFDSIMQELRDLCSIVI